MATIPDALDLVVPSSSVRLVCGAAGEETDKIIMVQQAVRAKGESPELTEELESLGERLQRVKDRIKRHEKEED